MGAGHFYFLIDGDGDMWAWVPGQQWSCVGSSWQEYDTLQKQHMIVHHEEQVVGPFQSEAIYSIDDRQKRLLPDLTSPQAVAAFLLEEAG